MIPLDGPGVGAVHVWNVPLAAQHPGAGALQALLVPDEVDRLEKFQDRESARNYLRTRAALRLLLGAYREEAPEAARFTYGPYGKPGLVGEGLQFNASHAGEWALIAIAQAQPVGVDLEAQTHRGDLRAIARRFFTEEEQRLLDVSDESLRRQRFFTLWTAKEALLKVRGEGIAHGLDNLNIGLDEEEVPYIGSAPDATLRLWPLAAPEGYRAALSTAGEALEIHRKTFAWEVFFKAS